MNLTVLTLITVLFSQHLGLTQLRGWDTEQADEHFSYNDPWRVEGYLAYGFRDQKVNMEFAKALLDKKIRIISAGNRRDVEQIGASYRLYRCLGRSNGSSIVNNGQNNLLTNQPQCWVYKWNQ